MKVTISQLPLPRFPVSEEIVPYVARTMDPSALAMKQPGSSDSLGVYHCGNPDMGSPSRSTAMILYIPALSFALDLISSFSGSLGVSSSMRLDALEMVVHEDAGPRGVPRVASSGGSCVSSGVCSFEPRPSADLSERDRGEGSIGSAVRRPRESSGVSCSQTRKRTI